MIAAFAFLAVPAALYMSNPEFTCGEIDEPPNERSASPEEEEEEEPQANEAKNNEDKKDDNRKNDKKDDKIEVKQEEKRADQKPKLDVEVPRTSGKTEAQRAIDEAKLRREKLLQAANEVLNKQDQPRSAEKQTAKQMENRRASTGSMKIERSSEFAQPVPPVPAPAPAPASFVRAEKTVKADAPDLVPVTPTPPVLSAPIIPRTNSAYKMRVEHQQAQQLASQLHAASPLGRPLSPVRTKINEPQQSETVSPRAREDRLSALANTSSASSPITTSNPSSSSSPARTSSSANMSSKSGSPVPVQALPPLPPRRREDTSPAQLSAPNSAPTPVATPAPAAAVAVVASAMPATVTASAYLTPREKQQRALAELRRQEEEQRNMAKVMIQEELQRALDELHKQEALQRQQDESERNLVQEEQRRRETVQQAILEEKLRIERDDELQREERRKLKEQQKHLEAQQRQADQRAMAELLLEVEKDRERDEKRAQAAQMSRSQQHLLDEEKILEQLRVQNQYPYPRGHPLSNVPSTSSANSKTTSQSASPVVSPLTSPFVSPHASMRIPRTSTGGPAVISPVASTSRDSMDGKATFSGIPTSTAGSFNGHSPTNGSGPNTGSSDGPYQSPYHSRLNRPASIQTLSPLSGSNNKLPSPAHPVKASASPAVSPESSPVEVRRAGSAQRFERPGSSASTPNGGSNGAASPTKHTAESVNRMIMEQMHSVDEEQYFAEHSAERSPERVVEEAGRRSTASSSRTSMTSSFRKSQTTITSKTTTTSTTSTTAVAAIAAARTPASPTRRMSSSTLTKESPHAPPSRQDEAPAVEEDAELRVLHAREDLALKIDAYIRTQKKFSSAVPRKHKVSIAKVNTDCDKYRKAYNEHVFEESLKINSLQNFLQSHPRFNVTGGGQMVGVAYLTPYQASENRRVFGHFRCTKCIKYWMESGVNKSDYREWQNGYSYKDCFQACKQCNVQVYPYHQRFLKKSELNFEDRAKHDVARCSRCETLRKPCYELDL